MARSGMPEDTWPCPDCGQRLVYNIATRSYLHVLQTGCKQATAEGVAQLQRIAGAARP